MHRYPSVLLFRYHNMRNELFKELREELKDSSRFVMGSNKMLQVALGKTPADELRTNLSLLSARLSGHVGLMFTRLNKDEARVRTALRCALLSALGAVVAVAAAAMVAATATASD